MTFTLNADAQTVVLCDKTDIAMLEVWLFFHPYSFLASQYGHLTVTDAYQMLIGSQYRGLQALQIINVLT